MARPNRKIARRQLDRRFESLRPLTDEPRPARGWVRAIREALGMSTTELAHRLGVRQSRIPALEQAEAAGTIGLDTLERVATALDCRLVYALVPRTSLTEAVEVQAKRRARSHLAGIVHNMRLEDQAVGDSILTHQIDELATELIDRRGLWAEPSGID